MDYFIIISIAVAVIAILYVWYVTRWSNHIPNENPVSLASDEDKLLSHWYEANTTLTFDFYIDDAATAAKFLRRIYGFEVDPELLVIGSGLDRQYNRLTGNTLEQMYMSSAEIKETSKPKVDCIFDIRSTLGKNGEIAIIHNDKIRKIMQTRNSLNLGDINTIIDNKLDQMASSYLFNTLKCRWEIIKSLNDPDILNTNGSYVYLHNSNVHLNDTITIFSTSEYPGGVDAVMTHQGVRINLLCSNIEFESMINRWKKYLSEKNTAFQY